MKKTFTVILAAMLIVFLFSACGGETDEKDETKKAGKTTTAVQSDKTEKDKTTETEKTTSAAVQGIKIETDKFSIVVPDGWENTKLLGGVGFQIYKESGEIVQVSFEGYNQGATHAKLQVESQVKTYGGTPAKEIELLGKTFWNTTYTANGVKQVFNACIENGVMISVKYAGPNLDTNPDYMKIINTIVWK